MLYEILHYIKRHCGLIWVIFEWCNSRLFQIQHRRGLKGISGILSSYRDGDLQVDEAKMDDVYRMTLFFRSQPEEAFRYFHPHEFDEKHLRKLIKRESFLMFLVKNKGDIVGYFFLRCFANGNAFKGRMVDFRHRNQGIAKLMGRVINDVVLLLGLRLYTTISPENYASLASTKAVDDIRVIRMLDNGYYYIECTPKSKENL